MRRVQPDDAPAPAEASDAKLRGIAFTGFFRPGDARIKIGHDLRIRYFRYNLIQNLLNVRELRHVTLARVELGGDREVARFREAARDVPDVLVQHHPAESISSGPLCAPA